MESPASWKDTPPCGHGVACAFQTHYCTYIRAPKLLALQPADPEQALFVLGFQAAELWLKVLVTDLEAVLTHAAEGLRTREPFKLLHRCSEILVLLDRQCMVMETTFARFRTSSGPLASHQLNRFKTLIVGLDGLSDSSAEARNPERGKFGELSRRVVTRARGFAARLEAVYRAATTGAGRAYAEALRLDELLALQDGPKADWTLAGERPTRLTVPEFISPDEMMFIIVHQAFELWFKAILQELDLTVAGLLAGAPDVEDAIRRMRRVVDIQRLLVSQIQIPATMLPMDFLRFRDERRTIDGKEYYRGLSPASGTESYQFREIEIVGGLRDNATFRAFLEGHEKLHIRFMTPMAERRLNEPTLAETYERVAAARGITDLAAIFTAADEANPHADLAELGDLLLEFDQFFKLWRVGHVSMVERMIGDKSGTGYLGPEYLRETAGMKRQGPGRIFEEDQDRPRFFPRLFATRARLKAY